MHALLEPVMGEKPALQPKAAIGPVMRAVAAQYFGPGPRRDGRPGAVPPGSRARFPARHEGMAGLDAAFGAVHPRCPALAARGARSRPLAGPCARRRGGAHGFRRADRQGQSGAVGALQFHHPQPHRSAARQRGTGGAHPGAARQHCRLARYRGGGRRAVAARSVRFLLDRGAAHRGLSQCAQANSVRLVAGQRRGTCIRCASASSTCAIRWI